MEQRNLDAEALALLYEGVEEIEVPTGFAVKDLQTADWAIGKAKYATMQIAEKKAYAVYCKARIDAWLEGETKKHDGTINTMAILLEPWVRAKLEGQKERSIKLPAGKAGFRKSPDKIELDQEAFVPMAKELGIPVQVREYVNKGDVKKYIQTTGNLPDNVFLIPGSDKFYLEVE
jgi:hypothetical protein